MFYRNRETGQTVTDYELEELYREMLDEVYGDVEVCGMSYPAGRVLKDVDPIAYRVGMSDWESEEWEEVHDTEED